MNEPVFVSPLRLVFVSRNTQRRCGMAYGHIWAVRTGIICKIFSFLYALNLFRWNILFKGRQITERCTHFTDNKSEKILPQVYSNACGRNGQRIRMCWYTLAVAFLETYCRLCCIRYMELGLSESENFLPLCR